MNQSPVLDKLLSSGITAVIRKIEPNKVKPLVQAFIDGGVSGIEITMDSDNPADLIHELKEIHGTKAAIGAGTVLNKEQAAEAINAGADFIFAPILDKETIEYTKKQGKLAIPGVFTPTEAYQAYLWGADMVKIFPASVVGPQFIKDVNGPLSQVPKMPTGGVNLENVESFIKAGAVAAGIGGSLVNKQLIQEEKWEELRALAEKYVAAVSRARG
ncbi:bifunctional 4-hydroxy-2-oxoglutarate aldolase/2-dehydro-3-deoxy-phosphogluconate aldolase [Sediminibacillus massiliensis]|uniref:bifunctional 4-hydroxy-2-oxoglutarate aldolase/2-dehydro-3-deoxy-phosphogluconate aldolase n=1 Tax=Sediminibacillus massiliensis TaxID=1926277 RepID=UPI0009883A31|nr:bifunctional 4-hydroxy-2-oxoglutarate aldolase/2-dehydro-3-deoxy-phosphogluconate aldolase [Sediminibacillus massiliensis]